MDDMITLLLTVLANAPLAQSEVPTLFPGRLFPTGVPGKVATRISKFEVVDFDADGHQDLVGLFVHSNTPPSIPSAVFVQLGDGESELDPVDSQLTPGPPGDLAVAHLDADEWLDVVVTHKNPQGFTAFFGTGGGHLTPGVTTLVDDASLFGIEAADMNFDGIADVILSTFTPSETRIALSNGDRSFAPAVVVLTTPFAQTADVDGQFGPDLIGGTRVALGTATPLVFQPIQYSGGSGCPFVVEDITGDGIVDVVIADEAQFYPDLLEIYAGNGDGTFDRILSERPTRLDTIVDVGAGDIDGDGIVDLVVHIQDFFYAPVFAIYHGLGDGAFAPYIEYQGAPTLGPYDLVDFDGDQLDDLVFAFGYDELTGVLSPGPDADFRLPTSFDFGFVAGLEVAALDGLPGDEIVATKMGSLVTWTSDGNGGFSELASNTQVAKGQEDLALADVDGDGRQDAVTIGDTGIGMNLRFHPGLGDGTFGANTNLTGGAMPVALGVGDLNSNGIGDLATIAEDGSFTVHPGQVAGGFGTPATVGYAPSPGGIIVEDLDRDGRDDVVINHALDALVVRYQNVLGALDPPIRIPTLDQPCCNPNLQGALTAGYWNEDAFLDIAVQVTAGVAIHLSTGPRTYGTPKLIRNLNNSFGLALLTADVNGDGFDDLLLRHNTLIVLFGDGRGNFPQRHYYLGPQFLGDIAVGNVDGLGGPDVVIGPANLFAGQPSCGAILINRR